MNAIVDAIGLIFELLVAKPLERIASFFLWREPKEAQEDPRYKQNVEKLIARNKAATESRE